MKLDLDEIQREHALWIKKNFPSRPDKSFHPLLGVVEEVGELSHAVLKRDQGIRLNENHGENIKDAVGDIVIYLLDFCNTEKSGLLVVLIKLGVKLKNVIGKNIGRISNNVSRSTFILCCCLFWVYTFVLYF